MAYSCVEAQYEDLSDTPWSLALPEKALMVVGPTEKGDSMATLDIWCQIVRDTGVDRNKTWKNPRFAALPGNSKLFFIFDTTVEAEEAPIQVRRVIQGQFLGPGSLCYPHTPCNAPGSWHRHFSLEELQYRSN